MGVPVMAPVLVLTARPVGRPVALKLVGLLLAVIWKVKAWLTVPLAVAALVITGGVVGAGLMVMDRLADPVPPALVALMVTPVVLAPVGVPEMTPVAVLTARPAGRPVAL